MLEGLWSSVLRDVVLKGTMLSGVEERGVVLKSVLVGRGWRLGVELPWRLLGLEALVARLLVLHWWLLAPTCVLGCLLHTAVQLVLGCIRLHILRRPLPCVLDGHLLAWLRGCASSLHALVLLPRLVRLHLGCWLPLHLLINFNQI